MREVSAYFAEEARYPDLDAAGAAERLSQAIRCRTVNHADHSLTDFSQFDRLQEIMRRGFPNVMRCGSFELIGHAVLITIPGTDASLLPCLYMSHQDVVPVVPGTEADWLHDAFSGDVADGCIWGRGTLDIKQMVFGILEAAEYLLSHGKSFRRTAFLAFGDDEETLNLGALAIAETLESRGVRLEFVLDEGGGIIEDGACYGAPGQPVSLVALMEKGYADLELSVESAGGHSSRPFGGSSLEHLARAITAVADAPFPTRLPTPMAAAFETLAPRITEEPLRTLVQDVRGNADAIAAFCASQPELFPFVTTTIAPTMIEGGSAACNVLPQNMRAVINFRLNEGVGAEDVMTHCREAVGNAPVKLRFLQANDPSHVARSDGYGYRMLREALRPFYPQVQFVPAMTVGSTDARRYERICDCCLRCSPFMTEAEDARSGVHGTNERLPLRSYAQGIRVLIRLMELANVTE
ncbi:MAG: M20/M25/M40 family metallo-hydrolase [Oscillospiraceae bacterium]|nr:M20/M25/M40 family metallo-hydrolase [Oscillospiraceae bacterium]